MHMCLYEYTGEIPHTLKCALVELSATDCHGF